QDQRRRDRKPLYDIAHEAVPHRHAVADHDAHAEPRILHRVNTPGLAVDDALREAAACFREPIAWRMYRTPDQSPVQRPDLAGQLTLVGRLVDLELRWREFIVAGERHEFDPSLRQKRIDHARGF